MTGGEIVLVSLGAVMTGIVTGIGGAYGAAGAVRREMGAMRAETKQELNDLKEEHGTRLTRVETRVGITRDGALTGNGLIGRMNDLEEAQGG